MHVDTMSKQHLLFMPENGKTDFKYTTELQIQGKHVESSCTTCKARVQQCTVNVYANNIQNEILIKQRECAKLWNETLDQLLKGKTKPDRPRLDSSLSDVICLDTDMEDNDIEELQTPIQLPLLSPIINFRTPSKTSSTVTPTIRVPVPNKSASNLSLNLSYLSTPVKSNLNSKNQTPVKKIKPPSATRHLSSHIKKYLIYSKQPFSECHVFWVNKFKKEVQAGRKYMHSLKRKLRKARNYENLPLVASLESEILVKEEEFAAKYIQRIHVTENLSTHQPMKSEVREAIYNPIKQSELFEVRTSSQQQSALITLTQYKENLLVLQKLNNKYAALVANELYYKEHLYKKVYLVPKTSNATHEKSLDSLQTSLENVSEKSEKILLNNKFKKISRQEKREKSKATYENSLDGLQTSLENGSEKSEEILLNSKFKKLLRQEKRAEKRNRRKRWSQLRKMDAELRMAYGGNKIRKPIETNRNSQSEPPMNEHLNLCECNCSNTTMASESSGPPLSSPRPNNIQPSHGKTSETTLVKLPSAAKFQPYKSPWLSACR